MIEVHRLGEDGGCSQGGTHLSRVPRDYL